MSETPYSEYERQQLILRDLLAIDRTILASERTFLAYLRTAMAFLITGASFVHFMDAWGTVALGWTFIGASLLCFLFGICRYYQTNRRIRVVRREPSEAF